MDEYDLLDDEDEILEGYCVRDKMMVEIENPQAVWTRRGMPATRGECPECGGTVFRMGRTPAHDALQRPEAVLVAGGGKRAKLARDTAYIAYAESDESIAEQIAADLEKTGVASWLHDYGAQVNWAGGVHPALSECGSLVVLLSPAALQSEAVEIRLAVLQGQAQASHHRSGRRCRAARCHPPQPALRFHRRLQNRLPPVGPGAVTSYGDPLRRGEACLAQGLWNSLNHDRHAEIEVFRAFPVTKSRCTVPTCGGTDQG